MKRTLGFILILLSLLVFPEHSRAQNTTEDQWKEVNRLISIKNYEQTLPILADLQAKALKEKDQGLWLRAFLARTQVEQANSTDDQSFEKIEQLFQKNIRESKPLIQDVLQNFYASYLSNNFHRYLSESKNPFIMADHKVKSAIIDSVYRLSIKNSALLKKENTEHWKSMFVDLKNLSLSPTLYHYLAHNYLRFLNTDSKANNQTISSLRSDLMAFNRENNFKNANTYLAGETIPNKSFQLIGYQDSIRKIIKDYPSDYNAFLLYGLAQQKSNLQDFVAAKKLLTEAKNDYPNSPWLVNVTTLWDQINKVSLSANIQKFALPDEYTPLKIQSTNVDSLYIRVYNTTISPKDIKYYEVKYDSTSFITSLDAKLAYEEMVQLKHFDDAQLHSSFYKINPLPYGRYSILLSNNKDFKDDGKFRDVSIINFQVTDVYFSAQENDQNQQEDSFDALMIHRKTGEPLSNQNYSVYEIYPKQPLKLIKKVKTDQKGQFNFQTNRKKGITTLDDYQLFIPSENQFIDLNDLNQFGETINYEDYNSYAEGSETIVAFTDRAIYRPGQPLYFKGILYNNHYLNGKVLPNQDLRVYLKDANQRNIDSLNLKTNEYGSVHGEFKLPVGTLTGSFQLEYMYKDGKLANTYFRVEEYKRPTFKVTLDQNKETYTLKDTARFEGKAESLSGAALAGAQVKYKVQFYSYKGRYRNQVYADSTTLADDQGKFVIKVPLMDSIFRNLEDFSINYQVEVINQSGEMQSASSHYSFSTKPWQLRINTPFLVEENHWSSINVLTTNKNNQPLKFAGELSIYRRKEPSIAIPTSERNFFNNVDYHLFSETEYKKYFPSRFDEISFGPEKKELIKKYAFDTRDTSLVKIDSNLFGPGNYEIQGLSIQGEDSIRTTANTRVFDKETGKVNSSEFLAYKLNQSSYAVGDQVILTFHTDVKDAKKLYLVAQTAGKKNVLEVLDWKDGKITYQFQLSQEQLNNNVQIAAFFIRDNFMEPVTIGIPLKRDVQNLSIKIETFRDKITPGQAEKWSFSISQKDKRAEAEVLASMYDTALDQFATNYFQADLYKSYPSYPFQQYYYLTEMFNSQQYPYSLFNSNSYSDFMDNQMPQLYNYGLWNLNYSGNYQGGIVGYPSPRSFEARSAVVEEVVVTGALSGKVAGVEMANDFMIRGSGSAEASAQGPLYVLDGTIITKAEFDAINKNDIAEFNILKGADAAALYGAQGANGVILITSKLGKQANEQLGQVKARTNLQETAFFFPELRTNENGEVIIEFDSPEALTRWKLMLFAHDKNLNAGASSFYTQTQKQLMVRPNLPRYFREGDEIIIKAQLQNLSKKALKGTAKIELINPVDQKVITGQFLEGKDLTAFETGESSHGLVEWKLKIPADIPSVQVKIIAGTDEFSDGEMLEIPILTNKVLINDSEKIVLKPGQEKDYLIKIAGKDNVQAKIQVQSNPILEIISALDYLKNYPYECTEQLSSKWFGLKVVEYLGKNYPAINGYFKTLDTDGTQSKLEANAELNAFKLEEMPWLKVVENDEKKLKELAQLFNSDIQGELKQIEQKILKNQTKDGGFTWFDGGKADPYISIRILEIFGKTLSLDKSLVSKELMKAMPKLTNYLDSSSAVFGPKAAKSTALDYLYARKYWSEYYPISEAIKSKLKPKVAIAPLLTANSPAGMAAKAWIVNQLFGTGKESNEIRNRLNQEVIADELKGMYWESNNLTYNSISMQAYMAEAYRMTDPSKLMPISQWLFYKKETNYWASTWMTVDAIYAILLANNPADFKLENTITVSRNEKPLEMQGKVLGQVSQVISKDELNQDTKISVKNNNDRIVYGGIYHQYFVPVENVSSSTKELSVNKVYLVERNGKWEETTEAKLGEKIRVRITVINDKQLQYVHLKDSRPSGVEAVYRPSGYQWWQGYYFSMKDASTNYFFDRLGKGKFTYEYDVKANNIGIFNSGITTAECMYDPSVNARSSNTVLTIIP